MSVLVGGDSIQADGVPLTVDVGFGYVDGNPAWRSYIPLLDRLSPRPVFAISVQAVSTIVPAHFLDVEKGDANPQDFPGFWNVHHVVNERHDQPTGCYMPVSWVDDVKSFADGATIPRSRYKLWSGHYGFGPHICGPATCRLCKEPCDGTQWASYSAWDPSWLLPTFIHAYPPTPTPVLSEEDMRILACQNRPTVLWRGDSNVTALNNITEVQVAEKMAPVEDFGADTASYDLALKILTR